MSNEHVIIKCEEIIEREIRLLMSKSPFSLEDLQKLKGLIECWQTAQDARPAWIKRKKFYID